MTTSPGAVDRLLVVDTISWRPHLETSMEIALVAREGGASVRYVNLRAGLPAVEDASWLPRAVDLNSLRIGRALPLLRGAGIEVARPRFSRRAQAEAGAEARRLLAGCADTLDLCRLRYDGFDDIGWGVLSSVVDATRSPFASLQSHPALFERFLASSVLVYGAARRAIAEFRPSAVALFNGRFATTRPILAAARREGVPPLFHERGCDRAHYWVAPQSIHDPDYVQDCIRAFWRPELAEAGAEYFRQRRAGVEKAWHSYTKAQVRGRVPSAMQDASRWVVFFTSSEDEFVAVGDKYANKVFPAQIDALQAVVQAVQRLPGHRLCVRMHPNIASKSREQIDFWRKVQIPGGLVVAPEETFDTYAILERASVVCSYGSTVGIEATYWERPSLLLGRSVYDRLDATCNAQGAEDVLRYLADPKPFPRLGALMFGAFFGLFGTPYRYYEAQDLFRGRILGRSLDSLPVRLARAASGSLDRFVPPIAK